MIAITLLGIGLIVAPIYALYHRVKDRHADEAQQARLDNYMNCLNGKKFNSEDIKNMTEDDMDKIRLRLLGIANTNFRNQMNFDD